MDDDSKSKNSSAEKEDEDVIYETDPEGTENFTPKKAWFGKSESEAVTDLKNKLAACLKEKQEYLDGWQRAKADLINARRRDEEERREFIKFANERLIDELLPVLESFELAVANKEAWEKADKNWRVGVEYIYSQLKKVLEGEGLAELNPAGEKWSDTAHEAAEFVPVSEEARHHIVLSVIQKGYSLNGKILKPPKVRVGEINKS